ncbi:POT family proton-dependent oligopeptide transporter [Apiospora marii]|uniref:POT family proton-dependent oligopeptide transporter n=1 Tax=Apiospora marii TaxID=335849 RepID=A0ABR1SCF7_9PEZI
MSAVSGALGLGQSTATNINNGFILLSTVFPVAVAVASDSWLGRYKTLCFSYSVYVCGCVILFVTSLPSIFNSGAGGPGLAVSIVLIGIAVGGVRATVTPFIGTLYSVHLFSSQRVLD